MAARLPLRKRISAPDDRRAEMAHAIVECWYGD